MSKSKFTSDHTKSDHRLVGDKISPDVTDSDWDDSSAKAKISKRILTWLLKQKWWVVLIFLLILAVMIFIITFILLVF